MLLVYPARTTRRPMRKNPTQPRCVVCRVPQPNELPQRTSRTDWGCRDGSGGAGRREAGRRPRRPRRGPRRRLRPARSCRSRAVGACRWRSLRGPVSGLFREAARVADSVVPGRRRLRRRPRPLRRGLRRRRPRRERAMAGLFAARETESGSKARCSCTAGRGSPPGVRASRRRCGGDSGGRGWGAARRRRHTTSSSTNGTTGGATRGGCRESCCSGCCCSGCCCSGCCCSGCCTTTTTSCCTDHPWPHRTAAGGIGKKGGQLVPYPAPAITGGWCALFDLSLPQQPCG